jgi:LEA14-like dessication related protein
MTRQQYVFSTLAVTLVFAFTSGCESGLHNLKKPSAKLTGLSFADANLDSATLLFDVEIDNHYPVPLPLTNFDYSLSSGATRFLSGNAESQTTVPAKSKGVITLPAKIDYVSMLKALKGVRPGSRIPYLANLGISVDTPALGLIRLPLKREGDLVLPTVSDHQIKDIWNFIKPK